MKGGVFQDCSNCPPMIEVPVGSFQMGNRGEDPTEQPVHEVALKNRFAIGIREVTYGEWMACVKDQGCKHASELTSTTDQSPMRDVSWADAVQYAAWLKKTTQQAVSAADRGRMGVRGARQQLDALLVGQRCRPRLRQLQRMRRRVESRRSAQSRLLSAQSLRHLYDMNGSVWEWVSDCWHSNYKGAPNDGRSGRRPLPAARLTRRIMARRSLSS